MSSATIINDAMFCCMIDLRLSGPITVASLVIGENNNCLGMRPRQPRYDRRMGEDPSDDATALQAGDGAIRSLAEELLPIFYDDLRRIGRRERRRVGAGDTLQTTALVNEAFLKLRKQKGWTDDRHFLCAAALAMRHALVNHAKAELTQKRGSGAVHVPLTQAGDFKIDNDEQLVALHDALALLAEQSPRTVQVVDCRFFGGYGEEETARVMGISERTVRRDWTFAKAWLYRHLTDST
jgi:RNA polymerase sigma factor (TIGR02999 family)